MTGLPSFACIAAGMGLVVIALWSRKRYGTILNPPSIQSLVWAAVVLLMILTGDRFVPVSGRTYALVLAGAAAFALGGAIGSAKRQGDGGESAKDGWGWRGIFLVALFALTAACLPAFVLRARSFSVGGPMQTETANIRYAVTVEREGKTELLDYVVNPSLCLAWLTFYRWRVAFAGQKTLVHAGFAIASAAMACTYGWFASGRTYVVWLLIGMAFVEHFRGGRPSRIALAVFSTVAVCFFVVNGILSGKLESSGYTLPDQAAAIWDGLVVYLAGPIAALDASIWGLAPQPPGTLLFRSVVAFFHRLGMGASPELLVQQFIFVPMPVNVYTFYRPYLDETGVLGVLAFQVLFGAVTTWVWDRARTRQGAYSVVAALLMYPLVMQIFQDQYLTLLSTWVQIGLVLGLYFLLGTRPLEGRQIAVPLCPGK